MGNIQTVGPNEALVVSGGCCRPARKQIIVGGWCWNTWMLTNVQRISLQVMTLNPKCEHVQSCHGVPVTVTGVIHCKLSTESERLPIAVEQFLGKSTESIKSVILHTVEGHLRAVIGTQTIDDICKKRQPMANLVREAVTNDLHRMGIDILSLTIKEIKDDVEYLSSSGKRSIALIKKQAAICTAKADSEAAEEEAKLENAKKENEIEKDKDISAKRNTLEMAIAEPTEKAGKLKAEAAKAYDLQMARLQKDIKTMEMEVKNLEFDSLISIQRIENERRKTELEIEIELPTKSEIYELMKQTEAHGARNNYAMQAEEFRIKVEGEAQAEATKLEGDAEAKGMKLVAEARRDFNEAACLFEVLKVLPEIAAEIASPLTKFEEIVLISEGDSEKSSRLDDKSMRASKSAMMSAAYRTAIRAVGGNEKSGMKFQKTAS